VRFNLPAVAASFTGREEELDALDDALGVADRVVITQAITGLGGIGKSQLAARYVQQRVDGYDVVAWIRAEDGGIADLAQLAAKLGERVDGLSPSEAAQLALEWLGDSEQRWLLAFDNVQSAEQLDGLRPRSGIGRVLLTSRDRALRQFGTVLTIDVFDEETATAYLTDRAGRRDDEPAARRLAGALGCLPLALSHAAAYCQSGTSFTDYLELLGELPARELFDSHPELSYAQTVASTWKASIQAASTDAPVAAGALDMAAHLGPGIAVCGARRCGHCGRAKAPRRRAKRAGALQPRDRRRRQRERASPAAETVCDDAAARNDKTAALRALAALDDAFPEDVRLPANWPLCEQLLAHALALADALQQPGEAGPQLINLLNRASDYLNRAEPGQRGLATAQITLRHAERVLGPEHPHTLTTRDHLALAYHYAGRSGEAIAILEPLLADHERILGVEHPETLTTRHNLALAYLEAGRVGEALRICEALLTDRERILGPDHRETLRARNNLGRAYLDEGRVDDAIAIYEPVLADRQRVLGPEHPETLFSRHYLARAYKDAGRIAEAITIYEALLADRERILGRDHPHTLTTRRSLALAYLDAGRVDEAIAILEPLLARKASGSSAPRIPSPAAPARTSPSPTTPPGASPTPRPGQRTAARPAGDASV